MKNRLIAMLGLLAMTLTALPAAPAAADVTWTSPVALRGHAQLWSELDSTTGTETANPPTTNPCAGTTSDHGICLKGLGAVAIHVEAAAVKTAGTLEAWVWNHRGNGGAGQWNRAPYLDVTNLTTLQDESPVSFVVTSPMDGVAFIPNGLTQASTIHLNATRNR